MYKLVIVGGKLRGEEFILNDGENILGRDLENDINIPVDGISGKHLAITVAGDSAYLEDLGSSNGTFLNKKLIKKATIKNGDQITLPDTIIQIVFVEEKKIIIKKKSLSEDEDNQQLFENTPMPSSALAKPIWFFKNKIMKVFYGINTEYEWNLLIALLLTAFVIIVITFTIFPIMKQSKEILTEEIKLRGKAYAEQIARLNSVALEQKNIDKINTEFLNDEDISSYELFTLKGRIIRPISKLNENVSDPFSVRAKEVLLNRNSQTKDLAIQLGDGEIGIARRIEALITKTGSVETVGIIAIRFKPKSLVIEASKNSSAYLESLVTSAIVAIIFYGMIFYLTGRPIEELKYQLEEALRGKRKEIDCEYLMSGLDPLKTTLNSTIQRIRELQGQGSEDEFGEIEDEGPYLNILREMMQGAGVPVMVLNSEKLVTFLNVPAEDITGIRESSSQGENLLDVAKEKGFAATLIEICDMSANNGGTSQEGNYELSGVDFNIFATALIGKDNFAKAFYLTFIKD